MNGEKHYYRDYAYSLIKLCNILFTNELSSILKEANITINLLCPRVINTKLLKAAWRDFENTIVEGAKHIQCLADSNKFKNVSGKYFVDDKITKPAEIYNDKGIRKKLWNLSIKYIQTIKK